MFESCSEGCFEVVKLFEMCFKVVSSVEVVLRVVEVVLRLF